MLKKSIIIIALILFSAAAFYFVYPKYEIRIFTEDDGYVNEICWVKFNRMTGQEKIISHTIDPYMEYKNIGETLDETFSELKARERNLKIIIVILIAISAISSALYLRLLYKTRKNRIKSTPSNPV